MKRFAPLAALMVTACATTPPPAATKIDPAMAAGPFASLSLGDRLAYESHDVLTALTWVAARTSRLRLMTSVLCLPIYKEGIVAKQVECDSFQDARAFLSRIESDVGFPGMKLASRLLALTAGHVCGAASNSARGDVMRLEPQGGSMAALDAILLDWQPNFARLPGVVDLDAGIAELDAGKGIPAAEVWKSLGLE